MRGRRLADSAHPNGMKYFIETYGCQMNVHDSERMAGLLESSGYEAAGSEADADLVVINTCSVREKAEDKLYARLADLKGLARATGHAPIVAVAGCVAQQEGQRLLDRSNLIDVIVGQPNYGNHLGAGTGRVPLYRGSATGPATTPTWTAEGTQGGSAVGSSVATAGDVNGDSFPDIILGAPYLLSGQGVVGGAFVHYGNGGDGLHRIPRQARADGASVVALLGLSLIQPDWIPAASAATSSSSRTGKTTKATAKPVAAKPAAKTRSAKRAETKKTARARTARKARTVGR